MPPMTTIWEAPAHTKAKIAILKNYLDAWFRILGRSAVGQTLLYVDGFAGPGEYTNHPEGSPIAALKAAREARHHVGDGWRAGAIHCAFIEKDAARLKYLQEKIQRERLDTGINVHYFNTLFVDGLQQVIKKVPEPFTESHPLFVFIDPFGATGAPFSHVANILSSPRSEVLIYLDADGIARLYGNRQNTTNRRHLSDIFGDDTWEQELTDTMSISGKCKVVLDLYQSKLRSLPNVAYVYPFDMRTSNSHTDYYLVFASQHYKGLEKMKGAMKQVDQSGDFRFVDTKVNQPALLKFDDPDEYARRLFQDFRSQTVTYEELRDYALLQTPFVNPKEMVNRLVKQRVVEVHRLRHVKGFQEGDEAEFRADYSSAEPHQPPLFDL